VDALSEHLEAVTETIRQRFLGDEPDDAAARTFTFRAQPQEMAAFREELFTYIRDGYRRLEASANATGDGRVYALYAGTTSMEEDED